jgi:O-antigen ligase
MNLFSVLNLSKTRFLSLLFSLIPVSFIAGNLVINTIILIIILSGLILFKMQLFSIRFFFVDKLIFAVFAFVLISGILNDYSFYQQKIYWYGIPSTTIKSFFFLKYLLLYIILRFLIETNQLDLKIFFISCSVASLFVCFDIFFQYIFGKDIFGFEPVGIGRKLSGPFGDELIAGGYIQRFSIFAFFVLPLFYKNITKNYLKIVIPVLLVIFLMGIIMSGNRMPLVLFIFTISLIVVFQKKIRKFFIPFVIVFILVFSSFYKFNTEVKNNFNNFYLQISNISLLVFDKNNEVNNAAPYIKEFSSFYDTWLLNKYIGGGIKNFRYYCHVRGNIDKNSKFICNMHPHNYYLEILTEIGLIGFFVIITIFSIIIYKTLFKKYFFHSNLKNNEIIIPFLFLFIAEIFPIKSTGSFFTTGNATYIFLIMAILIGLVNKDNSIEKKF